jgi:hypothetical protein
MKPCPRPAADAPAQQSAPSAPQRASQSRDDWSDEELDSGWYAAKEKLMDAAGPEGPAVGGKSVPLLDVDGESVDEFSSDQSESE